MRKKLRITTAVILGVLIIAGALHLRSREPEQASAITAVVGNSSARQYIEPEDGDRNGIPDWEDELSAKTLEEVAALPELASDDATANTLTDKFARTFFEQYIRNKATGALTDENKEQFLSTSISSLQSQIQDKTYTQADIVVGENSEAALREYGNAVMKILNQNSAKTENEAVILGRALQTNNEKGLEGLDPIIASYEATIKDTRAIVVPEAFTQAHIDLLNVYEAVHGDIVGMRSAFNDPLYTLLRMKRYQSDATALKIALANIYGPIQKTGIVYSNDEAGKTGEWFLK